MVTTISVVAQMLTSDMGHKPQITLKVGDFRFTLVSRHL